MNIKNTGATCIDKTDLSLIACLKKKVAELIFHQLTEIK